ncbi:MAG: hypothetical protein IT428_33430 [Planctomycetaceae bacterium]|nr:hypothetical protein [Planctomycetaceae bacterium]
MLHLMDEALEGLRSENPESVRQAVLLACSFFECARGQTSGLYRKEVLAEPASREDIERLRGELVDRVRHDSGFPATGGAVFALSKLDDPELTAVFVEVLRRYLHTDASILFNAMIALRNLGYDVFAGRRSMSILPADENCSMAAEFLRRWDCGDVPAPFG